MKGCYKKRDEEIDEVILQQLQDDPEAYVILIKNSNRRNDLHQSQVNNYYCRSKERSAPQRRHST